MKRWFKGKRHPDDWIDFQTSKSLYEIKSCNLFNKCVNGNHKRPYKNIPHKQIQTTQLGRFQIDKDNHVMFKDTAETEGKIPRYVFVVVIGRQKIWRLRTWKQVDSLVQKIGKVRIKDVFT